MERKEYVLNWFAENSTMSLEEIRENININYFENGLIDSFAFLEMITSIETEFNIFFCDSDFADDTILTISGLIDIVESK